MAIFASTTTSGYSDPMKAYNIKALELRQKEMMAQQAKDQAGMFTPENTQTPIQGLGQVANIAADKFNQSRLEAKAEANRDQFAKLRAGIDPEKGPTQQQIADMGRYDDVAAAKAIQDRHDLKYQSNQIAGENLRSAGNNATTRYGSDQTLKGVEGGHAVQREGFGVQKDIATQSDNTARAGQQVQIDLATMSQKARREEAIAQRDWESKEKRLAEVANDASEAQKAQYTKERDEAKFRFEKAQQDTKLAHDAEQGDKGRTAEAQKQDKQIEATKALAEQQFGYSKETKASDNAFTAAQAELDRAAKSGDRQAQIAAAKALAEAAQANERGLAADKNALDERIANHKIEAASLAAKTTPDYIKASTEAKDTYANHLLSVEKLKEARALAPTINTGPWQALQTGTALASGGRIGDQKSAEATTRFNSLMDEQAILAMSKTLKGQSTDFEMKEFKKVFNNANASPADRLAALDRLIAKADTELTNHREALKSFTGGGDSAARIDQGMRPGGGAANPPPGGGGGDSASVPRPPGKTDSDLIAEAKAAHAQPGITAEQRAAVDKQLQQWLMGR